jgi:hypothetical protein
VSERSACQAMHMNRWSCRYVGSKYKIDTAHRHVESLSQRYVGWGYRKIYELMRETELEIRRALDLLPRSTTGDQKTA